MIAQRTIAAVAGLALGAGCASVADAGVETGFAPVDGGALEYVVTGPADGDSVLLIHGGWLGTAFALVQDEPALAGHRVIRMHRRGFVGSSDPDAPLTDEENAADAIALLDALGVERAHVVGHSAASPIVLQMAADAPDRVASIVLLDPSPPPAMSAPPPPPDAVGQPPENPIAQAMALLQAGEAEAALETFSLFVFGPGWREEFFDAVPGGYEQTMADIDRTPVPPSPVGPPSLTMGVLAAMDTPALVVWGGDSGLAGAAAALADTLPNAEGWGLAGTGHALITQKPDEVAAAIADFIERHPM